MQLYVVRTVKKSTGETIAKSKPFPFEESEVWASRMNAQYPDLNHLVEPVSSDR